MTRDEAISYYRALARRVVRERKVILGSGPLAATTGWVKILQDLGAQKPLVLCDGRGTGTVPDSESIEWIDVIGESAEPVAGLMESVRRYGKALRNLPPEARDAVRAYDPDREALVFLNATGEVHAIDGRPGYASRPASWQALEDKVRIDAFWDAIGIPRPPTRIVRPEKQALLAASRDLDRGAGVVWAADARDGLHGGADGVRWIREPEQAEMERKHFASRSDRVRVAPFLEGIPCSIHGIVFPRQVAVFRPVELVIFRRENETGFLYAGAATFWDPPYEDRQAMRALARKVGRGLRGEVAYRGAFTIDGVMTRDGFLPTELNTRFGAGLNVVARGVSNLPLVLIDMAVRAGEDWDFQPEVLEALIVEAADENRSGGGWAVDSSPRAENVELEIVCEAGGVRRAEDEETPDGKVVVGPSNAGTFVRFTAEAERTPTGVSIAPRVKKVFAFVDDEFGTRFEPIAPAADVRSDG